MDKTFEEVMASLDGGEYRHFKTEHAILNTVDEIIVEDDIIHLHLANGTMALINRNTEFKEVSHPISLMEAVENDYIITVDRKFLETFPTDINCNDNKVIIWHSNFLDGQPLSATIVLMLISWAYMGKEVVQILNTLECYKA